MNCFIKFTLIFLFSGLSLHAVAETDAAVLGEGMVNPGYHEKPAWFKESFLDIREDIDEASDAKKRVLLYFYQDGCPYCGKLLKDNFGDAKISDYSRKHFDVIAINMWGDREVTAADGELTTEKAFAKSLKVQFTPTMLFLDETGTVLLRVNGYFAPHKFMTALSYVAQRKENDLSVREYFLQTQPQKASGILHDSINTLARVSNILDLRKADADKPLLVIFEQKICSTCDELHQDIFKRKEVVNSLQPYAVIVLDSRAATQVITPSGETLSNADWAKKLGIYYSPSMVFFDTARNEVFRTEGYLKTFHTKAALDYVSTQTYTQIPEFQRYVQKLADDLHARGIEYDLMD